MTKIALIGAGSISFTRNISSDILLTPSLKDATISLMDIDLVRLNMAKKMVEAIVRRRGLKAKVEASLDRRVAMQDTDFVITTFQVGGHGIRPTYSGPLPPQCAAILRTNVNVQELIVHAAKTHKVKAVHHPVMMDPLVGAVCTLPQIHAMTNEMLAAQGQWLPYFKT